MKTIGHSLRDLLPAYIESKKNNIMSKCCISGSTEDGLRPAIVRIVKDGGQEMTISGMVASNIKAGRRYQNIGKVISVIRKGVKTDFIVNGCNVIPAFRVA